MKIDNNQSKVTISLTDIINMINAKFKLSENTAFSVNNYVYGSATLDDSSDTFF